MFDQLRRKKPSTTLPRLLFYEVACFVLRVVTYVLYRFRVYHVDRVPATGTLLLAGNHQSYLDPPLMTIRLRQRHVNFIARSGLFKSPAFASVISWLNALPIREDAGDTAAIKETISRLQAGEAVLIFPEGSRSSDGAQASFKRGVALLVKKAKCPVLPVAVEGAFDTWPSFRSFPRLLGCRLAVMYGRPIAHEELMRDGPDAALQRLADEIESMRRELRARLRRETSGRFPPPGAGDGSVTLAPVLTRPSPAPVPPAPQHAAPSADGSRTDS